MKINIPLIRIFKFFHSWVIQVMKKAMSIGRRNKSISKGLWAAFLGRNQDVLRVVPGAVSLLCLWLHPCAPRKTTKETHWQKHQRRIKKCLRPFLNVKRKTERKLSCLHLFFFSKTLLNQYLILTNFRLSDWYTFKDICLKCKQNTNICKKIFFTIPCTHLGTEKVKEKKSTFSGQWVTVMVLF